LIAPPVCVCVCVCVTLYIPEDTHTSYLITFRVSRRRREMYSGHAPLSVCLSVRGRMPTLTWAVVGDVLQLCTVGRICNRCTGCVVMATYREREMSASACLYSVPGYTSDLHERSFVTHSLYEFGYSLYMLTTFVFVHLTVFNSVYQLFISCFDVCSLHVNEIHLLTYLILKAKFHYAIWSQTGPRLVADLSQTC